MEQISEKMAVKCLIDMRNIYKPTDMRELGFHYVAIGKPVVDGDQATEELMRKAS